MAAASDLRALEQAIARNAYDVESWQQLMQRIQSFPIDRSRPIYERFTTIFPTSARHWAAWLQAEFNAGEYKQCDALYQRCLYNIPSIDLWLAYIRYAHFMNAGTEREHATMESVYEDALRHVSMDIQSPQIFTSYIQFLGTLPASSTYEETQRMQKQRRVYQRAVVTPGIGVDEAWRDWDRFEHSVNKTLAIGLLTEYNPRHLQAKQVSRERRRRWRAIRHDLLASPPTARSSSLLAQQNHLWRELIEYEMSNPMHLSPGDLHQTVLFAYRQSLLTLGHEVYMQHEFLCYLHSLSVMLGSLHAETVNQRWKEARDTAPYSMLLAFAHAEYLEDSGKISEAKSVYEQLIKQRIEQQRDSDERREQCEETETQVRRTLAWTDVERQALYGSLSTTDTNTSTGADAAADDEFEAAASRTISLLFIQFMRFARRTEGPDAARKVFLLARKSKTAVLAHCYTFASLLDYRVNKNTDFAAKIFQSGLDKFANDRNFIDAYTRFLLAINDHTNLRLAIERAVKDSERAGIERKQKLEDEKLKDKIKRGKKEENKNKLADSAAMELWEFGCRAPVTEQEKDALTNHWFEPQSSALSLLDTVPPATQSLGLVWRLYVDVERWLASEVATIDKAELRREVALGLSSPTIARLTDRYRFQDLWPTSSAQRAVIAKAGNPDALFAEMEGGNVAGVRVRAAPAEDRESRRQLHPRPQLSSLIHCDPSRPVLDRAMVVQRYGAISEAIIQALIRMPPPAAWQGPVLPIDTVIAALSIPYPDRDTILGQNADSAGDTSMASASASASAASSGEKRKRDEGPSDEGDLFKQRRQQKLKAGAM